jgi:FkbM family methyltransferase
MTFYSDNGLDKMLSDKIDSGELPKFGYACDVGASDGTNRSNTMFLEELGWLVLCVEPNPLLEEAGRKSRKLWRTVACGKVDEEAREFFLFGGYPYESNCSLEPRYCAKSPGHSDMKVPVRTLNRLLEEAGFPRLDVLTVDVEGYEGEVLEGLSLEVWKPKIVALEDCDGASFQTKYSLPENYTEQPRCHFDRIWQRNPE